MASVLSVNAAVVVVVFRCCVKCEALGCVSPGRVFLNEPVVLKQHGVVYGINM